MFVIAIENVCEQELIGLEAIECLFRSKLQTEVFIYRVLCSLSLRLKSGNFRLGSEGAPDSPNLGDFNQRNCLEIFKEGSGGPTTSYFDSQVNEIFYLECREC